MLYEGSFKYFDLTTPFMFSIRLGNIKTDRHLTFGLNSIINESIPAYNYNISLSVKQVNSHETLKLAIQSPFKYVGHTSYFLDF